MSYQPIILGSGLAGWQFLKKTYDTQLENYSKDRLLNNNIEKLQNAGATLTSAAKLMNNYHAREVTLTAFGLQDDIQNKFFIQKILNENPKERASLSARLADKRYSEASQSLGFFRQVGEDYSPFNSLKVKEIGEKYIKQKFLQDVGNVNNDYRIALYAREKLVDIANGSDSEKSKIYKILGDPPLRQAVTTALGLPKAFSGINLDQQVKEVQSKFKRFTGSDTFKSLADEKILNKVLDIFIARSDATNGMAYNSRAIALTLLQN